MSLIQSLSTPDTGGWVEGCEIEPGFSDRGDFAWACEDEVLRQVGDVWVNKFGVNVKTGLNIKDMKPYRRDEDFRTDEVIAKEIDAAYAPECEPESFVIEDAPLSVFFPEVDFRDDPETNLPLFIATSGVTYCITNESDGNQSMSFYYD